MNHIPYFVLEGNDVLRYTHAINFASNCAGYSL